MKKRIAAYMAGRYGMDALGRTLHLAAALLLVAGAFTHYGVSAAGTALAVYAYYRVFSRARAARLRENAAYCRLRGRIKAWLINRQRRFAQRKTHRFYTCAQCRKTVRIPKGKGAVTITCPVCGHCFKGRT